MTKLGPLPPVPRCAKVVIHGQYGGYNGVAVFHVRHDADGWFVAELNALCTGMRTAWKNRFLPLQASGFGLGMVEALDLSNDLGNYSSVTGTDSGGDFSAGNSPNSVACVVSWKIPRHYRGGRPRTYIWGLKTGTQISTNSFTSTFTSQLTSAATAFIADTNGISAAGSGVQLGCVHYIKNKAYIIPPTFDAFTTAVVHGRIDSQRRRLGKETG